MSNVKQFPTKTGHDGGGDHNGGSGGGSDLEARVAKLESHVEYMRRDIADLRSDVKALGADTAELKTSARATEIKLDHMSAHMVTRGQLSLWALIGLATVVGSAIAATWWIAQQYLGPILKSIATLPH